MRKKLNKRKQELPLITKNIIGILLSSFVGTTAILILTVIISFVLKNSANLSNSTSVLFIISILIGAFATGFIASKQCSFKGIVSGLVSSLLYLIVVTIIMLFFTHSQINETVIFLYIGIIITAAAGGIFSANTKKRK